MRHFCKHSLAWLYAPLFFFGFIGAAALLVAEYQLSRWWLVVLGVLAVAVSFLTERLLPYDHSWNRDQGDSLRDTLHAIVNETTNAVSIAFWGVLTTFTVTVFSLPTMFWPHDWPFVAQLAVALVVADAGISLAHYASHKLGFLWRLHAVHHSVKRMYGFNGLMKHPLHQAVEGVAGFAPLALLGVSPDVVAVLAFAVAVNLLLQHSNVDMRLGPLRYVFAFAPVHRFHHMRYGKSGDVNFGFFLNLWDYLLGTAFFTHRHRLSSEDLGIDSYPDFPKGYVAQLLAPLRWKPSLGSTPTPEALQTKD